MLVVTRKQNESITITMPDGRQILVMVTELILFDGKTRKVSLGITAPTDITVHRTEVKDALDRE